MSSLFTAVAEYLVPTAHAEAPEEDEGKQVAVQEEQEEDKEEDAPEEEEEEEEEDPEDIAPEIRKACEESPECREPAKHFQHCAEKIEAGKGWHGEDCVEELFHLMHCVDTCSAPKIFKKLV